MAKLHETLAVETTLKKTASKLMTESIKTLGKDSLFMGRQRDLKMLADDMQDANTSERQMLTTTVDENLEYLMPHISKYWDLVGQKEVTNGLAKADIVINGKVLAANLPATFLLGLETKLSELRKVYEAIPTLAPGIKWSPDESTGKGVFKAEYSEETLKTEKTLKPIVKYEATEHHPAQVDTITEVIPVGRYTTQAWCGMLTPAEKAARLDRIDQLVNAVKKARMRANSENVVDFHVGDILLNFINNTSK